MPLQLQTTDIRGQLVFLGTGTSVGVPCIGCGCPTCTSDNPKNKRTRCSLALGLPEGNLLIDTTPDLRTQLLRESIGIVHTVLYTHDHADHVFGLDDVRLFPQYLGHALPVYCEDFVEARIRKSFDYAFTEDNHGYGGGVPELEMRRINSGEPFTLLGQSIRPFRLWHGKFRVLGFRIGNIAYCTDTGPSSAVVDLARGADLLIAESALRPGQGDGGWPHLNPETAIALAKEAGARRLALTHFDAWAYRALEDRQRVQEEFGESFPGLVVATDGLVLDL